MDPNAALADFLQICREYNDSCNVSHPSKVLSHRIAGLRGEALASLEHLQEFIAAGGFLPRDPSERTAADECDARRARRNV